ncbi:hypothetical protein RJZ56_005260 [Blastomyces dermatitidis]
MAVSLRGVFELFRCIGRVKELNVEILGFSISHNHRCVRIYGHYPVIEEDAKYYRHLINSFDFTNFDGKERWTSYKFVLGVYQHWAPSHLRRRLCSAIDELPDVVISSEPQRPMSTVLESTRVPQAAGDIGTQRSSVPYSIGRKPSRPEVSNSRDIAAQEPKEETKVSKKRLLS